MSISGIGGFGSGGFAQSIGLSSTQRNQIQGILQDAQSTGNFSDVRSKIASILTPQQKQEAQSNFGSGAFAQSIGLSDTQRNQIQGILQGAQSTGNFSDVRSKIAAILTPQQKQQVQSNLGASPEQLGQFGSSGIGAPQDNSEYALTSTDWFGDPFSQIGNAYDVSSQLGF